MKTRTHYLIIFILICLLPLTSWAEEIYFYHTDNFDTPMVMSDMDGIVVWQSDELPFGEEYETVENPLKNNRRFLGKELDEESGLIYMGARYLDPKTGRFNRTDPVGLVDPATGQVNQAMLLNPQRQNRYVYGLNNPYRYVDPDGNWAEAIFIEGPSIAVGAHSLVNNIKQGNFGSAALDAGGIIVDGAAALAPGIPGGVGLGIKASRAAKYIPAPSEIKGISGLVRTKSKTAVQGGGGLRKRWKSQKGSIYEWDSRHGTLEKYNKRGKHQGEFDHLTGKQTKPANKKRKVDP